MKKRKFECMPYPNDYTIGEIQVSVELTDKEIAELSKLSGDEYDNFIKSRATVKITDFDVLYEVPKLSDWDVIYEPPKVLE